MKTFVTKPADVERKWYVIDASGKVLGKLAAEAASILRGKKKPLFQPNVDAGDYVIIINADKIRLTGMKEEQKSYFVASMYAGHSRLIPLKKLRDKHPGIVVEKAIKGMLPHNPLGSKIGQKLHVYAGPEHEHKAQKPQLHEF